MPSDPIRVLLHVTPALLAALGPEFYVDEGAMRHAGLSRILAHGDIHEAS